MVVGIIAIGVMAYLVLHRPSPPSFAAAADIGVTTASSSATSVASPTPSQETPTGEPSRVLVIGDGYTAGRPPDGSPTWPSLLSDDLEQAGMPVTVDVAAADGSGYAKPGTGGATFVQLVKDADKGYDVVVFFGSHSDNASARDVQAAAEAAFRAVERASPHAELLAIGPSWATPDPPGYILTNRDAVAAAAAAAGVTFVDPLAQRWFGGDDVALLGPDGRHPTAQGHRYLADKIQPLLEPALSSVDR
jgi:lysophospholipase L1-like esterase